MTRRAMGAALLALLWTTACGEATGTPAADDADAVTAAAPGTAEASGGHDHHAMETGDRTAAGEVSEPADMSIYHLSSAWTDADGRDLELGDLGGRVQVVAMVYTNCAFACPRIVGDMKRIEAETDARFVLVSIDPERDTPDRLRTFAEGSRLTPERWTLLAGADDDLLELAMVLGVRYRRISDTDFMHSNILTVLDEDGEIIHRQMGLGRTDETIAAIRRHTAG